MIKIAVLFLIFGVGSLILAIISTINITHGDLSIDPISVFCFYAVGISGIAVAVQLINRAIDDTLDAYIDIIRKS